MKQTLPDAYYSNPKVPAVYTRDNNLPSEILFTFPKEAHHLVPKMDLFYCFYGNCLPFRATK